MGVYIDVVDSKVWGEKLKRLLRVLEGFVRELMRSDLLEVRGINIWVGEPVESLGGRKVLTLLRIEPERIAEKLRGELYYSIEVEGILRVKYNGDLWGVPCEAVASTLYPSIYGDVTLETFQYYGTGFEDYFKGQSSWAGENRDNLLAVLKKIKRNEYIKRIVVGSSIESLRDISSSMYLYYRRIPRFLQDVYGLWRIFSPNKLKEKQSVLEKEDLAAFGELAPISDKFIVNSILAAKRFEKKMEEYIEKYATVEKGSITIYNKQFETTPILRICETILLELRRMLQKTIPKKEELKKDIVKEAEKAEFKEKPRLNHYTE